MQLSSYMDLRKSPWVPACWGWLGSQHYHGKWHCRTRGMTPLTSRGSLDPRTFSTIPRRGPSCSSRCWRETAWTRPYLRYRVLLSSTLLAGLHWGLSFPVRLFVTTSVSRSSSRQATSHLYWWFFYPHQVSSAIPEHITNVRLSFWRSLPADSASLSWRS